MKFNNLRLKPFGKFVNETIHFSPDVHPTAGFYMVIGANEAGKSTTLAAIERLLFGFPKNDNYNILNNRNLWIGAEIIHPDQTRFDIWRRNTQRPVLYENNQITELPGNLLENWLTPINADIYKSLFSLNQDKLREGGEKLASGTSEFSDILFGESLGELFQFNSFRDKLRADATILYRPDARGVARSPLNNIKSAREALKSRLEENSTKTSVWRDWTDQETDCNNEIERLRRNIAELKENLAELDSKRQSLNNIGTLLELREQLGNAGPLPVINAGLETEFTRCITNFKSHEKAIADLEMELSEIREKISTIEIDQRILDATSEISSLAESSSGMIAKLKQKRELEENLSANQDDIHQQMRELGLDSLSMDQVPVLQAGKRVDLTNEAQAIAKARTGLREIERDLTLARQQLQAELPANKEDSSEVDLEGLQSLLADFPYYSGQLNQLASVKQRIKKLQQQRDQKIAALPLWSGTFNDFLALDLPIFSQVQQDEKQLVALQEKLSREIDAINSQSNKVKAREKSIQKRREELVLPSLEELTAARESRDSVWQKIQSDWTNAGTIADADKPGYCDRLSESITLADQLADRLRISAEILSDMMELEKLKEELNHAQMNLEMHRQESEIAFKKWAAHYSALGIEPDEPSEVAEWPVLSVEIKNIIQEIKSLEDEINEIESEWSAFLRDNIKSKFPELVADNSKFETIQQKLTKLQTEWIEQRSARKNAETNRIKTERLIERKEAELSTKTDELRRLEQQWQAHLQANGLDANISTDSFETIAAQLSACDKSIRDFNKSIKTIEKLGHEIDTFNDSVHQLTSQIKMPEYSGVPTHDIKILNQKLNAERELATKLDNYEKLDKKQSKQLELKIESKSKEWQHIAVILAQLEVSELSDADARFKEINDRNALNQEIQKLETIIQNQSRNKPLELWIEETKNCTVEVLTEQQTEIKEQVKLLELEHESKLSRLAELRNDKKRIQSRVGEGKSIEIRNEQKFFVEKTAKEMHNYIKFMLTTRVLEQASEEYKKSMGDRVLDKASSFFKELSFGGFQGLKTMPTKTGGNNIVAVRDFNDPDTDELHLEQLSEGTKDQLFLSLKLAMIQNRLEEREKNGLCPLPVIFDDVLVQFDDNRSRAAFRLFAQLAEKTQVIFLTHHQHLEDVAFSALGSRKFGVHHLGSPEMKSTVFENAGQP